MSRLLHALAVGLVGAGLVHIVILFLIPQITEHETWRRLSAGVELNTPTRLDKVRAETSGGPVSLDDADPMFDVAACRFDLADGPLHVSSGVGAPFWSVSIYNGAGRNIRSFNDRATASGGLDFVVLTPAQMTEMRKEVPDDLTRSNFVESESAEGVALVRAFVEDESWTPTVARFFSEMKCEPLG